MTPYGMQLKDAEEIIDRNSILNVLAEQQDNGEWAFFITFQNKASNSTDTVYIERQRQGMRTWADPAKCSISCLILLVSGKVHLKLNLRDK